MSVWKFNKATAAVIGGAIVSIAGSFFTLEPDMMRSIEVVIVGLLVLLIPNAQE